MRVSKEAMEFLINARIATGQTQSEVAARLNYISPQYVSNWERGVAPPPFKKLKRICRVLKADKNELTTILVRDFKAQLQDQLD